MNCVRLNTICEYEHVIIDNNSQDGTYEWFKWMKKNTTWLDKVKYVRMSTNLGDWGGMVKGLEFSGDYVVQLDNDIIVPKGWLSKMYTVLEKTNYEIVMLKRKNVSLFLNCKGPIKTIDGLEYCYVERPVACYLTTKKIMQKAAQMVKNPNKSKYILGKLGKTAKLQNVQCAEIEGLWHRQQKYSSKNPNIWEKI